MSILKQLFSSDKFKQQLFDRLAREAKEKGIKRILITINDKGGFDTEILDDEKMIVTKKEWFFLHVFYSKNKHMINGTTESTTDTELKKQ